MMYGWTRTELPNGIEGAQNFLKKNMAIVPTLILRYSFLKSYLFPSFLTLSIFFKYKYTFAYFQQKDLSKKLDI